MKVTENALNVLTTLAYRGIGRAWIVKNFPVNESINKVVSCLNQKTKNGHVVSCDDFESRKKIIRSALNRFGVSADGVVTLGDPRFPLHRGTTKDGEKPVVLFYRGNLDLLARGNKNIAVIGLLTPSMETEALERRVVAALVEQNATIVSGLALGCDTIAHSQALLSGGKTVAILPSPLNDILPKVNGDLAEDIVRCGGLLVSEYCTKASSKHELSSRYVERDRLQALFSDCVVLSASYAKNDLGHDCGSRHAMECARRYSIPRAAIYDANAHESMPEFDLNRQLIDSDPKVTVIGCANAQASLDQILCGSSYDGVQRDLFS